MHISSACDYMQTPVVASLYAEASCDLLCCKGFILLSSASYGAITLVRTQTFDHLNMLHTHLQYMHSHV